MKRIFKSEWRIIICGSREWLIKWRLQTVFNNLKIKNFCAHLRKLWLKQQTHGYLKRRTPSHWQIRDGRPGRSWNLTRQPIWAAEGTARQALASSIVKAVITACQFLTIIGQLRHDSELKKASAKGRVWDDWLARPITILSREKQHKASRGKKEPRACRVRRAGR